MEANFNLRERTVLIVGPFSTTIQGLVKSLTEQGADCVLLSYDSQISQRFCAQISDAREVNNKFGRATSIQSSLDSIEDIKEAISKVAQMFGSVDIYIDAMLVNKPTPMTIAEPLTQLNQIISSSLVAPILITQTVLNFLKSRKRGRILYLINESNMNADKNDLLESVSRTGLIHFAKGLAKQVSEYNITVNTLSIGLTEELVLGHYPEAKSIKEAIEILKTKDSTLKITESDKIANVVVYLVSQMGVAITGQNLQLT